MAEQKPSVGRIVHCFLEQRYVGNNGGRHTAAGLVTGVNSDGTINVRVFLDGGGDVQLHSVPQGSVPEGPITAGRPGEWVWPPRV